MRKFKISVARRVQSHIVPKKLRARALSKIFLELNRRFIKLLSCIRFKFASTIRVLEYWHKRKPLLAPRLELLPDELEILLLRIAFHTSEYSPFKQVHLL
jgi:hypothetical protein